MFDWLIYTNDWPARWNCGIWPLWLGWIHIASDWLTFIGYILIPVALGILYRKRPTLFPNGKMTLCFITFIFACGITHLISGLTFWWPIYHGWAIAKLAMALATWATLIVGVKLWPTIITYRSPVEYEAMVRERDAGILKVNELLVLSRKQATELIEESLAKDIAIQLAQEARLASEKAKTMVEDHMNRVSRQRDAMQVEHNTIREILDREIKKSHDAVFLAEVAEMRQSLHRLVNAKAVCG